MFFSLILNAFVCTNKYVGDALSDHLLEMLNTHYTQLKTILVTFQSTTELGTETGVELAEDN